VGEFFSGEPLVGLLTRADVAVFVAVLGAMFLIAFVKGRKEADTADFFLGARRVPVVIAALSFVATEVSAVTLTNVPGTGFTENLQYLQFYLGSAASKLFVAFLFLPVFYRHQCTSIYEFLRHRFGAASETSGSIFFFITRLLASGARLYAACYSIALIMGWADIHHPLKGLLAALALFTVGSIAFIAFGGIKAVVWTGAYQASIFYLAGGAVIVYLLTQLSGGAGEVWRIASEGGRLSVFDFSPHLNRPTTFWAGTANAFFIGLAIFGTDQELVQRLLTVRTRGASQRAILTTILAALPVVVIYLAIGTLMFVFFAQRPDAILPSEAKNVFPYYIAHYLPGGLRGLMLAAIVLASIDSPLASLSSSFVMDLYKPLLARGRSERHYLWVSRLGVVGFGIVLAAVALACTRAGNILWLAFQIISITGGSLLGVFLLGILTHRGSNRGNILAMVLNAGIMTVLTVLSSFGPAELARFFGLTDRPVPAGEQPIVPLAWSWLIVLGTAVTFALGLLLGPGRTPPVQPSAPEAQEGRA
jgi:SSS family solute:Na+ symporter